MNRRRVTARTLQCTATPELLEQRGAIARFRFENRTYHVSCELSADPGPVLETDGISQYTVYAILNPRNHGQRITLDQETQRRFDAAFRDAMYRGACPILRKPAIAI